MLPVIAAHEDNLSSWNPCQVTQDCLYLHLQAILCLFWHPWALYSYVCAYTHECERVHRHTHTFKFKIA